MNGATYYNLQRSTDGVHYALVSNCSGTGAKYGQGTAVICRDPGLTPGTSYSYHVQSCSSNGCSAFTPAVSNVPVSSNCTNGPGGQIPDLSALKAPRTAPIPTASIDPQAQFMATEDEFFSYPTTGVQHRDLLVVDLPGSGGKCGAGGGFADIAKNLGYDYMCVNYPNAAQQNDICVGNPSCYGNVSQAKLDATGPCSKPGDAADCGKDPHTKQPFYNDNPHDGVVMRITTMLQYLVNNGYNDKGTDWSQYLNGNSPNWERLAIGGFSQGGVMGSYAAYIYPVARVHMRSSPPSATLVNGQQVAATYYTQLNKVTPIQNFYGLVSVNDPRYTSGIFAAVWEALGFTASNNDEEEKLSSSSSGINCSSGVPSHSFSTNFMVSPGGGHDDTLAPWNEDVIKFMFNM